MTEPLAAPAPLRAWVNPGLFPVGSIGAPPDGDPAAIAAAEHWLRAQGCTRARGPLDGSTWYAYRANLGPHDTGAFPTEPSASPEPWLARGYREVARYVSTLNDNLAQAEAAEPRSCRLVTAGWDVRDLEQMTDIEDALRVFYRISVRAFAGAFSYTPIGFPTFRALYEPWLDKVDRRLVLLAIDPDGEPGAFLFAFPDASNPGLSRFVIKTLAVDPAHAGRGVGSWLVGYVHSLADVQGLSGGGIHALMWVDNASVRIGSTGHLVRAYALYEKAL